MLHDRRRNYAGLICEGTGWFIVAEEFDAQADAGQDPQRGSFACHRIGTYQTHMIQHFTSDEGVGGTSIDERQASVRRNGVTSAVHCNFSST